MRVTMLFNGISIEKRSDDITKYLLFIYKLWDWLAYSERTRFLKPS